MANKKKVVLIGWDAADWQIIRPLLVQGKMPTLQKMMQEGVHGNLSTMNPPYSPMLWTSVATGKTPDKHGVLGFLELDVENQKVRPVTVSQRKVKAIWNILHHNNLKSNVVGWWPSHPAEPIKGSVISDAFSKVKGGIDKKPIPEGAVHPASLLPEIADLRINPSELTGAHILPFIPKAAEINQDEEKSLKILGQLLAENSSVHACSTYTMENTEWDFTAIYYDWIDHICHAFMKFHPPRLNRIKPEMFELYKDVVNNAYRYQDMMLERTLELAGEDALVIVMSDHGYISDHNRMLETPDVHAGPALDHREFGIFVAKGPGVKKGEQIFGTSLLDITPTLLAYYGIPVGEDMDGLVMQEMFEKPLEISKISSWEEVEGDFGMHTKNIEADPLSEQNAMEQLIELGYVQRPDDNIEKLIRKTKSDLEFNLARVYMGRGEKEKAINILVDLVERDVDTDWYFVDLINLLTQEKRFEAAKKYLFRLRKVNPSYEKKTKLLEAKIWLGLRETDQAKKILIELENQKNMAPPVHFELGKLMLGTDQLDSAIEHFKMAVNLQEDNAKYHHALAKCYVQKDLLEEAMDHALTSVELVRYFPDAHYTLGTIFQKMGDDENAKMAFETAAKLNPKAHRAKHQIKKMNSGAEVELANSEIDLNAPEITIVSGLPRSGTSMMMQMLNAAGLHLLTDGRRTEDKDNPKGYFEFEKVKNLAADNSWVEDQNDKVIKVIAQLLKFLPNNCRYKVIFMSRNLDEVLASQQIMLKNNGVTAKGGVKAVFQKDLERIDRWVEREPGVEMLKVDYHDVIENPGKNAERVAQFLGKDLDIEKMIDAVDGALYRNRVLKSS